jgi:hypothetical protein
LPTPQAGWVQTFRTFMPPPVRGIVTTPRAGGGRLFDPSCLRAASEQTASLTPAGPSRDWIKIKNPDSPAMRRAAAGWRNTANHDPAFGGPRATAESMGFGSRMRRFRKSSACIALCLRSSNCPGPTWCRANTRDRKSAIAPMPDRWRSSEPQLREPARELASASRSPVTHRAQKPHVAARPSGVARRHDAGKSREPQVRARFAVLVEQLRAVVGPDAVAQVVKQFDDGEGLLWRLGGDMPRRGMALQGGPARCTQRLSLRM